MHIDLDSIKFDVLNTALRWAGQRNDSLYYRKRGDSVFVSIGIKEERFIDWRSLERSAARVRAKASAISASVFDTFKSFMPKKDNEDDHDNRTQEVWAHKAGTDEVLVYRDRGFTIRSGRDLITEGLKHPHKTKPIVLNDKDAAHIVTLNERSDRYWRRSSMFESTFRMSIEVRLRVWIKQNQTDIMRLYHYDTPRLFVIKNDDRKYVVTASEYGEFKWSMHEIYECH